MSWVTSECERSSEPGVVPSPSKRRGGGRRHGRSQATHFPPPPPPPSKSLLFCVSSKVLWFLYRTIALATGDGSYHTRILHRCKGPTHQLSEMKWNELKGKWWLKARMGWWFSSFVISSSFKRKTVGRPRLGSTYLNFNLCSPSPTHPSPTTKYQTLMLIKLPRRDSTHTNQTTTFLHNNPTISYTYVPGSLILPLYFQQTTTCARKLPYSFLLQQFMWLTQTPSEFADRFAVNQNEEKWHTSHWATELIPPICTHWWATYSPNPRSQFTIFFQYYRPQTHTHTTQAHLTIQFRMSSQLQLQLTSYLTYLQLQYLQLAS